MAKTMTGWRATYTDGTRYNSVDHVWADIPTFGLQVMYKYYEDDENLIDGVPHKWVENHNGADAYYPYPIKSEADIPTIENIKFGEEMDFQEFLALHKQELKFAQENTI